MGWIFQAHLLSNSDPSGHFIRDWILGDTEFAVSMLVD